MITTVLIGLIILGAVLQGVFIAVEHREKYVGAVILKGLASLCFVLIGLFGFQAAGTSFAQKIFIGLILGMFGDICLNLRWLFKNGGQKVFLTGIVFFLAGHILYLAALIPEAANLWLCAGIGTGIALGLLIYIYTTMEVKLSFKIFGVFYLGAVIIMTAIAIGIAIAAPATKTLMYAIGAVLFTVSDIVLIFNTFSGVTRFSMRITNLSLYYAGQLLIALSLFLA